MLSFAKTNFIDIHRFLIDWLDNSDYISVSTSGSTGKPRVLQLKKEFMVNSAIATANYFDLKPKTKVLLCLPTNFIAGKMMLVRAIILGWHIDVVDSTSNPIQHITSTYDFSAMIPLQLFNSLDKLNKIKKLIIGGGHVSKELQLKIKNSPTKIYATYGMTETVTHIAIKPLNKASGLSSKNEIYKTLPNVTISKDKRECLVIDAPKVSEKILITNDIVEIFSDNSFQWIGRFDNIINSGGVKLIPEKVEGKFGKIIEKRFFVAGLADKKLGEKLILIIEGNEDVELLAKINGFQDTIESTLSKFEIPKDIYFVEKFTETKTKKINRKLIIKKIKLNV